MTGIVVVGSQWGDEGKGKVTDVLAESADYVVRFQGGNNAGHTVVVGKDTFKFHLLPSGVVQGKEIRIAQGVVLDPRVLADEIEQLEQRGISPKLKIDPRTHIILPYHNYLDEAREQAAKKGKLGTTLQGIGPCYEDKAARSGIRFEDLIDPKRLKQKLGPLVKLKATILKEVYGSKRELSEQKVLAEYTALGRRFSKYLGDVSSEIYEELEKDSIVLFEGAQGTLLDLAFGTYPYVTSSHPISGSVFINVGIPPKEFEVLGIVKAYTTRVGEGPFPTELFDDTGEKLRKNGHEFGTTTGRPRRCGWLDLPMLRYSHRLNGFTQLALTKLDVLSGQKTIKVATAYRLGDKEVGFQHDITILAKCEPVYEELPGFTLDQETPDFMGLPHEARDYISFIEGELGVPITIVSIGPKRKETLFKSKPV